MNSIKLGISGEQKISRSLRLLPGIIIVLLQWLIRFGIPAVMPQDEALMIAVFGGIIGGIAIVIWWIFFSRAPVSERLGAIILIIITLLATSRIIDKSISTANMGTMFPIFSIPIMSLAFVIWAVVSRNLSNLLRRVTMVATILVASGFWALLRTNGMTSDLHFNFSWRWAETQEERFLSQKGDEPMAINTTTMTGAVWPGFRGQNRDGIIRGVKINTDWKASPPIELWRRKIGPGCSSFAISGDFLFTQEQRGDKESVTCYNLTTGKPIWIHSDKARFWDSHAGAGPRSTPTLSNGRIYTVGATGILDVLNAIDGTVLWSRNIATDTGAKDSGWGFTSSPLVIDSNVIVAATGKLVAYNIATGEQRWFGPEAGKSYSSPQLMMFDGISQILMISDSGATSLSPSEGKLLWRYQWKIGDPVLQPAMTEDGEILITGSMTDGMRRLSVAKETTGWIIKERWKLSGLKPYFNDFVIHKGHAYGFNGRSLACIDLKNGKRNWQGGRYGGQILLLSDQDLLLVLSEKGELALVAATPDKFTQLAQFPAITGKTWNHPVLAGDVLVVRNSEEMAAFRLSLSGS